MGRNRPTQERIPEHLLPTECLLGEEIVSSCGEDFVRPLMVWADCSNSPQAAGFCTLQEEPSGAISCSAAGCWGVIWEQGARVVS